jgi:hypothetical protein
MSNLMQESTLEVIEANNSLFRQLSQETLENIFKFQNERFRDVNELLADNFERQTISLLQIHKESEAKRVTTKEMKEEFIILIKMIQDKSRDDGDNMVKFQNERFTRIDELMNKHKVYSKFRRISKLMES